MDACDELRSLLGVRGVTTALVGAKAGVSGAAVSQMSRGRLRVSPRALRAARAVVLDLASAGLGTLASCLTDSEEATEP